MVKNKVLFRRIKGHQSGKRISLFGTKSKGFPLFRKVFYQKNTSMGGSSSGLSFRPADYLAEAPLERKKLAYEDAQQHKDFYQEVIDKGYYPPGTKVRVKRERHSDTYALEITMPKVSMAGPEPIREHLLTGAIPEAAVEKRKKGSHSITNFN